MKRRILGILFRLARFFSLIQFSQIQKKSTNRGSGIHVAPLFLNKGGMTMFKHWRENSLSVAAGVSLAIVIFMTVMGPTAVYAATNSAANVAGGSNTLTASGNVTVTAATLQLVKQVWTIAGACLASSPADATCNASATTTTVPSGTTLKFLIFVKNTTDLSITDTRFSDALDVSGAGFTYVAGQIRRTQTATPPTDAFTALQIFNDANGGTGLPQTDALSNADFAAFVSPNLTVGGDNTAGQNATLAIAAHTSFGVIFQATKN